MITLTIYIFVLYMADTIAHHFDDESVASYMQDDAVAEIL